MSVAPARRARFRRRAATCLLATLALLGGHLVAAQAQAQPETSARPAAVAARASTRPATVVSLTFDDANADQLQAVQLLDSLGMNGTFFVPSGYVGAPGYLSVADLQQMQASGHEIGGHTVNHGDLTTVDPAEAARAICLDRATLTGWGLSIRSFAYPFASTDPAVETAVQGCGYNSARMLGDIASRFGCYTCDHAESMPPEDPYYTKALDEVDRSWTLLDLQLPVLLAESTGGGWVQYTFHHVCAGSGCDELSVSPARLSAFLTWLKARESRRNDQVRTVGDVIGGAVAPVAPVAWPPAPAPGVNGVANADLEATGADGLPACFMKGGWGTNQAAFTPAGAARSGSVATSVTVSGYVSGDAKLLPTFDLGSCAPTVTAGHSYSLRAWYTSSTVTQYAVYLRGPTGAWQYWTSSPWFAAASDWTQAVWDTPPIPDGTTGISFGLSMFADGTITSDDYALYDADGAPYPSGTGEPGSAGGQVVPSAPDHAGQRELLGGEDGAGTAGP